MILNITQNIRLFCLFCGSLQDDANQHLLQQAGRSARCSLRKSSHVIVQYLQLLCFSLENQWVFVALCPLQLPFRLTVFRLAWLWCNALKSCSPDTTPQPHCQKNDSNPSATLRRRKPWSTGQPTTVASNNVITEIMRLLFHGWHEPHQLNRVSAHLSLSFSLSFSPCHPFTSSVHCPEGVSLPLRAPHHSTPNSPPQQP